jgi:hypothetical protein
MGLRTRSSWPRAGYRVGNLGATPAMARVMLTALFQSDARDLLPMIRLPTLVMHRQDISRPFEAGHGRYLAEHIAGARYVELPGRDLFYWVGESRDMLDEIEEFLTGVRGGSGTDRVLATVLVHQHRGLHRSRRAARRPTLAGLAGPSRPERASPDRTLPRS